jgi:hypothetical protein
VEQETAENLKVKRLVLGWVATTLAAVSLFAAASLADPASPSTQGVMWGGRGFLTPAELSDWLIVRGLSYDAWARNHPGAAARLEGREHPETAPAKAPVASGVVAPAPAQTTASLGDASSGGGRLLSGSLATLAATLLVLAFLPALRLRRVRLPNVLEQHQLELAGGGVAIAIALGAAYLV